MVQPSHVLKFLRWREGTIIESFLVEASQILVGRNTEAEIALKDLSVSRRHLVVTVQDGQIFLEDQKTSGGTRVAGVPLPAHQPKKYVPGDAIYLGKCEDSFTFELFRNYLSDEELASEVAKNAKLQAEAVLNEAQARQAEILAHAQSEAAELQKKAHMELLNSQREADAQKASLTEQLQGEISKLRGQMEAQVAEDKNLLLEKAREEARGQFTAELADLNHKWQQEKDKELSSELEQLKREHGERVEALSQESSRLKQESEEALQKALADLKTEKNEELEALNQSLALLRAELETLQNEKAQHSQKASALEAELKALSQNLEQSAQEIETSEKAHSALLQKIAHLEKDYAQQSDQLKGRIKEETDLLESSKKQMEENLAALQTQAEEAKKLLGSTEQARAQQEAALESLRSQKTAVETELKELSLLKEDVEKQITELQSDHSKRKEELFKEASKEILELRTQAAQDLKAKRLRLAQKISDKEGELTTRLEAIKTQKLEEVDRLVAKQEKRFKRGLEEKISTTRDYLLNFLEESWPKLVSSDSFSSAREMLNHEIQSSLEASFIGGDPGERKKTAEKFNFDPERALVTKARWKRRLAVGALACSLMVTAYLLRENFRTLGENSDSSRTPDASEVYAQKAMEEKKRVFSPATTPQHKDTYTKNILYTTDYASIFLGAEFQDAWVIAANDFFVSKLGLSDNAIVRFIAKENELVSKLRDIRSTIHPDHESEGIDQLVRTEEMILKDLKILLEGERRFTQFKAFSQQFFNDFIGHEE